MSSREAVWAEVDCPGCLLDEDFEPPPRPTDPLPRCSCGHQYTAAEFCAATFYCYDSDGFPVVLVNPFVPGIAENLNR